MHRCDQFFSLRRSARSAVIGQLQLAEAAGLNSRNIGHPDPSANRTKAVVALGQVKYQTSYRAALEGQARWKADLRDALRGVDFIALPTMQTLPPRVPLFGGTLAFEVLVLGIQNTAAVNLAGVPAVAVPVPVEDRVIPVTSLQLVGRPRSEAALLNAARLVEAANPRRAR